MGGWVAVGGRGRVGGNNGVADSESGEERHERQLTSCLLLCFFPLGSFWPLFRGARTHTSTPYSSHVLEPYALRRGAEIHSSVRLPSQRKKQKAIAEQALFRIHFPACLFVLYIQSIFTTPPFSFLLLPPPPPGRSRTLPLPPPLAGSVSW